MTPTLESVLANARHDAASYRRRGDARMADVLESLAAEVADACEDYLRFLDEPTAILRSGHLAPWFRKRRAEWAASGNARRTGRRWYYRALVVPQRGNTDAAYQAGLASESAA